jgi:hypothetical protein
MAKLTYNISIKGNGTIKEITESLKELIISLDVYKNKSNADAELDGVEWEDETLCTNITA